MKMPHYPPVIIEFHFPASAQQREQGQMRPLRGPLGPGSAEATRGGREVRERNHCQELQTR